MTPEQRARLREAAGKATPGPWNWDAGVVPPDGPDRYADIYVDGGDTIIASFNDLIPEGRSNGIFITLAQPRNTIALLDALDAAEKEREAMTLAICGGEDAPGYASSLSHETVLRLVEENHATLRSYSDLAFDGDGATWKARATAAEARVALLEGLVEDYDTRILLAHDALEAARDKMRGAVEEDDQRAYDRVHTAIYVLRSRQSRALAAKLEGRGDG